MVGLPWSLFVWFWILLLLFVTFDYGVVLLTSLWLVGLVACVYFGGLILFVVLFGWLGIALRVEIAGCLMVRGV